METIEEAQSAISKELAGDDAEVRREFEARFGNEIRGFAGVMAVAFVNWRSLDSEVKDNERLAYVSAWVYTALNVHVNSMKLLIAGHQVAAGNLFRQVVETMALAIVSSSKDLNVLDRFIKGQYSTNDAIHDAKRHATKLGINKDAIDSLGEVQKFYHQYSHPSIFTISAAMSFAEKGLYVGAAFDEGKMEAYTKEVNSRLSCAEMFSNFIDGVKMNVAGWR